jgi:tRNA uridine 5-carboxymethylaminomethyl modification enzyme
MDPAFAEVDEATRRQLERDALYANYIERQERDVEAMARDEAQAIPEDFDYTALSGLSHELRQKHGAARPATLAQAGRVEGMTPAALTLILARVRQARRKSA